MMRYVPNILILPLLLLGASSVAAQEDDRDEREPDGRSVRERLTRAFDENGDGRLNEGERAQARAALRRMREVRGDDARRGEGPRRGPRRDGADRRELRVEGDARRNRQRGPRPDRPEGRFRGARAEMLLARFDRDGDRELDLRELRQLLGRMAQLRGGPGGPSGRPRGPAFGRPRGPRPDGPPGWREFGDRDDRRDGPPWQRFDQPRGFGERRVGPESSGDDDAGERRDRPEGDDSRESEE